MLGRGRSRGAAQGIPLDDAPGGARDVGPGGDALDDEHADHNLRSAYLHVLADAMTSVAAIGALVAGKYFGANWMDPFMGIAGAILVSRWSIGLVKQSSAVLLDQQAPQEVIESIRRAIEEYEENTVTDVHVWSIGPAIYAAEIWLFTDAPRSAGWYKSLLPDDLGLVHVTVEVHYDDGTSGAAGRRGLTELRRLDDDEKGAA
jgi:cation diffusion facilitator family transporter